MYTADDARKGSALSEHDWDQRIQYAVENWGEGPGRASIRVYVEDGSAHTVQHELEKRGFRVVHMPSIMIKGDVTFEWDT